MANLCCRWLLVCFLVVSPCFLATYARRGGSSRGSSSRGSSSRPSPSRPAPSYSRPSPSYSRPSPSYSRPSPSYSRPAPAPAPAPAPRPNPWHSQAASKPVLLPSSPSASKPSSPVVVKQPAYNPNFKESNSGFGTGDRQPAYNPNYKPVDSKPAGPPPPYSPAGHPVPNVPVGPPPSYQQSGSFGNLPSGQPPPYPGQPGRPPGYPGLSPSYPSQPGSQPYPKQPGYPGSYPRQPELNRPYVVQPGYPGNQQQNAPRPYPVQPAYPNSNRPYPQQPGMNRPYPVQPGYPGGSRPYPQQPLGGNVWQPHYGMPAPSYMNYGGIPTGTNMYTKPHKKQGFIGSLMSAGKIKPKKKNKYYGSYPSPYGIGGSGIHHGGGGFLGKYGSSPAMYTIFPYKVAKKTLKIRKPKFGFMPFYTPHYHYRHHHHYHYHNHEGGMDPEYAMHFDVYNDSYIGKCQKPIKKQHKVNCNSTFDELQCIAKCEEGYKFANGIESVTNKCWHVTGVWKPKKNFPECMPVCDDDCINGGECIAPGECKCPAEYRGSQCQFHFLRCDILTLIKEEDLAWSCKHLRNETTCRVRCKSSREFDLPPAEYKCTPEGVWKPDTLPQCDVAES